MNWDQIKEFLPLLIFLALWLLGQAFGKKTDPEDAPTAPEVDEQADNDPHSTVEEDIRRKIAERQREGSQNSAQPDQHTAYRPAAQEPASPQPMHPEKNLFAEQKRRLEETQASVRLLQKQLAQSSTAQTDMHPSRQRALSQTSTIPYGLDAWHRDPQTLRRAFVYHEILGTPLGLRRNDGSSPPLWQS